MAEFYAELSQTARELIAEFGTEVTFTRRDTPAYDPATGGVTAGTLMSSNAVACIFNYPTRLIDGTNIMATDFQCFAHFTSGSPRSGDDLSVGGRKFGVVNAKPIAPALITVLWELQLREVQA